MGVLVADGPTASAMVDTTSALPVGARHPQPPLDRSRLRAVVVNAGKANAATGSPGLDDAHAMAARAAAGLGLDPGEVAVCSTGTIGERLDMGITGPGIDAAVAGLSGEGGGDFGARDLHHRPGAEGRRIPPARCRAAARSPSGPPPRGRG